MTSSDGDRTTSHVALRRRAEASLRRRAGDPTQPQRPLPAVIHPALETGIQAITAAALDALTG